MFADPVKVVPGAQGEGPGVVRVRWTVSSTMTTN